MFQKTLLFIALALTLSGCFSVRTAQAPIASTYPLTHQQKMQAAHHWDVLAAHQARLIAANEYLRTQPLYIGKSTQPTPFNEAFDSLLASQLVSAGAHVTTRPERAVQMRYHVQVVEHHDRSGFLRAGEGTWTTLTTGIAVATLPFNHWREPALALIPAAAAADLFSGGWASRSHREVIITTQAIDGSRVAFSSSNIYYINAADDHHYRPEEPAEHVPSSRNIPLTETW